MRFRPLLTNKQLFFLIGCVVVASFADAVHAQRQASPPAKVPEVVAIPRPSADEIDIARRGLKKVLASADAETKAVIERYPGLLEVRPPRANSAIVPNLAGFFRTKHEANLEVAKQGDAEVLFMGDSITDFWRNEEGRFAGKSVLDKYFGDWKVANFGIAGDTTQGVLYRLQNGEGEGFQPKAVMLMIGTNNIRRNTAAEIAEGIGAVVMELRTRFPAARILLLAVFPRGGVDDPARRTIADINRIIARLHDGERVHYHDIGERFLDAAGNIPRDVMSDGLHPSAKGYEIWAQAVKAPLAKLMASTAIAKTPATVPEPVLFTTQQDRQNMLDQLGITKLRPGRSSNAESPNAANYDEAKANPYPELPEILKTANGQTVDTPESWWKQRRPQIAELLEREVYGRIPENVPKVKWDVKQTREVDAGDKPAIQMELVGIVDNSGCPEIEVNISMSLTLPKETKGPVPVLMSFGRTPFDRERSNFRGFGRRGDGPRPPSKRDLLIAAGWGCATLNPSTVQDDSGGWQRRRFGPGADPNATPTGAGLTRGIIGLTNLGQPRTPEQWGALRAWGWGASQALDYLETVKEVDSKRVGIAGVSRYGKAALVAMAFDRRITMGLIASSGAGGTALYRREFGECLENLATTGGYHWMAGNYLKYSADEASFGRRTAADLPVDSHMTIALCAPRLTFISHGIPEKGDAHWLDHQGSFMAAIAAQPVFRLLGARGLGRSDDYHTEKMPAVNVDMLDGHLAWRQHDGGHTDGPNVSHFIRWADKTFAEQDGRKAGTDAAEAHHRAIKRTDQNSITAHEQLLAKTKQGKIDVYFEGDSITRRWGATDYPRLLANWNKNLHGWNAANFAWGGDNTHNIIWRLQNGEFDGLSPKVIVLQAGTNNLPWRGPANEAAVADVVEGIQAITAFFQRRAPHATIILTAVFPRTQNMALKPAIDEINQQIATLANGSKIRFLNINDKLADATGRLLPGMARDGLHLEEKGCQVWADALKPILTELLGPPAQEDQAPPATGNPAAAK